MHRLIAAFAAALLILSGIALARAADLSADAQFKAIYTTEWAWREAQFAGEDGDDLTRPIADHLPDVSAANQAARLAYWTDVAARLDALAPASLLPAARLDYAIYRDQIAILIADQRLADYEMPVNSDSTFWGNLGSTARRTFHGEGDYRAYIAQLRQFPRYFAQQIDNMRAGEKRDFTPPKVTLAGRDVSLTAVTQAPSIEANLFYAPFKAMPAGIPVAEQAALRAAGARAIAQAVIPAHLAMLKFMRDEYLPGARESLAADDLPDGAAYYRAKIKEFTTLDLTPAAIHQIGLAAVAKIHGEMLATMKETGFKGDFPAFLHFLRTDPQFYAKTPQELLWRAAWIAKQFDGKEADFFGYLPRRRFAIKPVPADMAPYYTSGRGGPDVYLVNTYDLPSRPLYNLTALTLHESAPGHALQGAIALEHKGQPMFRQKVYISAYGEGWAVYCEKLGLEMGLYETPYDRFGMLTYQMWRAARLVVDTGIHSEGWTRERAVLYLHDNTALSDHEIATEVDRYISWPGQALSYYLGEMAFEAGRAKAEKALGPKFNIRAFHDTVLEMGSVPLPVLSARIDQFIADGGAGPYPDMEK